MQKNFSARVVAVTKLRLLRRGGKILLMPENDNYEPIDGTGAEIIGLVKAVVREY